MITYEGDTAKFGRLNRLHMALVGAVEHGRLWAFSNTWHQFADAYDPFFRNQAPWPSRNAFATQ